MQTLAGTPVWVLTFHWYVVFGLFFKQSLPMTKGVSWHWPKAIFSRWRSQCIPVHSLNSFQFHVNSSTVSWIWATHAIVVHDHGACHVSRPKIITMHTLSKFGSDRIFNAPKPKAQVHYCDHALSIVRPSLTFHIFRLLLWNRCTEFNETGQEARTQHPLPILCFSGRSEKQDGRPGFWLTETFSTSLLKPLNRIQRNLTGSKISMSSPKFVFFGPIGKTRWPPWPLIGWDIFDFSSETTEGNSTKLDRKQDLNVLYQVCVSRADRKNKMAALASDWLRHSRLPLWSIPLKGGTLYSSARYVALWASCLMFYITIIMIFTV